MYTDKERKILIELICNKQTEMLIEHPESYDFPEYQNLERIKIKVKEDSYGNNYDNY